MPYQPYQSRSPGFRAAAWLGLSGFSPFRHVKPMPHLAKSTSWSPNFCLGGPLATAQRFRFHLWGDLIFSEGDGLRTKDPQKGYVSWFVSIDIWAYVPHFFDDVIKVSINGKEGTSSPSACDGGWSKREAFLAQRPGISLDVLNKPKTSTQ